MISPQKRTVGYPWHVSYFLFIPPNFKFPVQSAAQPTSLKSELKPAMSWCLCLDSSHANKSVQLCHWNSATAYLAHDRDQILRHAPCSKDLLEHFRDHTPGCTSTNCQTLDASIMQSPLTPSSLQMSWLNERPLWGKGLYTSTIILLINKEPYPKWTVRSYKTPIHMNHLLLSWIRCQNHQSCSQTLQWLLKRGSWVFGMSGILEWQFLTVDIYSPWRICCIRNELVSRLTSHRPFATHHLKVLQF